MTKKKMLFIYNPRAGKGTVRTMLSYILEEFGRHDMEITVHPTIRSRDAAETMRSEGSRYDLVVCSGGDGTLDEVVDGMMRGGFKVPVGYIPAGSTNDFAGSLGIPREMADAAASIAGGKVFSCDVGRLNDEYFIYVAAFGAFTEVSYSTSQDSKNALGHLAYVLEGMKSLPAIKNWKLRYESRECSGEGKFLYGMITNSNSVGGFKGITGKNVTLNDGLFEVTLIEDPENILDWPAIVNALLNHVDDPHVITFKTSHVEFYSDEEIPWTTDGEFGGSYKTTVLENLTKALPIILGRQPDELEEDPHMQSLFFTDK